MPRPPRVTAEGMAYHVINRRTMRLCLFNKPADYEAFERILALGLKRPDTPAILAWCLMPNHWHLVLLPGPGSNLSTWMQWLSVTHTHRYHQHYHTAGEGPLYQGRFKSFPIQTDEHLLTVMRYVEANALRAGLAQCAEAWRWGSLWVRQSHSAQQRAILAAPPVDLPRNWAAVVNEAQGEREIEAVRRCVTRGSPFGDEGWVDRAIAKLDLQATVRRRGRPRKEENRVVAAEIAS